MYLWGKRVWGWGGGSGNFTTGLPHDIWFKYGYFLSVQENIQQRDYELLLLTGFSFSKSLTFTFDTCIKMLICIKYELDRVSVACFCEQIICLSSHISVSCLNLPSSRSLPSPFSVIFPLLGTIQGFLRSGLSSGKTLWPVASVSCNLSNHVVKREDFQKDWRWKEENQVGRRGKKQEAQSK